MPGPFFDAAEREWEKWQEVCKLLREFGFVTEGDLSTPVSAPGITPGLRLIQKIVEWGQAKEELAVENFEKRGTRPLKG